MPQPLFSEENRLRHVQIFEEYKRCEKRLIVSGAWIVRRSRNVSLNLHCRNETIPILRALQHIYSTPKVRDSILRAIARDVNGKSKATRGRPGLSYWEILVLAGARLGCGYDYDELQDLAENHRALRQLMGVGDWESEEKDKKRFDWRRIESNVNLLRPETIQKINQAIIEEGHRLQPQAAETVRGDSFVVETNIHYPTDSSLIADGLRKVLGLAATLAGMFGLIGWRQHKHLFRKARKLVRKIDRIAARKGNGYQERLKQPYRELLEVADLLLTRAETTPRNGAEIRHRRRRGGPGVGQGPGNLSPADAARLRPGAAAGAPGRDDSPQREAVQHLRDAHAVVQARQGG